VEAERPSPFNVCRIHSVPRVNLTYFAKLSVVSGRWHCIFPVFNCRLVSDRCSAATVQFSSAPSSWHSLWPGESELMMWRIRSPLPSEPEL